MNMTEILITAVALSLSLLSARMSGAQYTAGHADLGAGYEGGGDFFLHFHLAPDVVVDGQRPDSDVEFEPSGLTVLVPATARVNPSFGISFLGSSAGQPVWVLPMSNFPGLPFLGLATEELLMSDWNGPIRFTLESFTGPGEFALWVTDAFGSPLVKWRTNDGVDAADFETLAPGSHNHYTWGFTVPGTYQLEIRVLGEHKIDGVQSNTETVTFHVVPEPGFALHVGAMTVLLMCRRRRSDRLK